MQNMSQFGFFFRRGGGFLSKQFGLCVLLIKLAANYFTQDTLSDVTDTGIELTKI